jgi:KTSC domain
VAKPAVSFSDLLAKDAAPKKPVKPKWEETPNSSNLRRFLYDPTDRILLVDFRADNRRYGYADVPRSIVARLRRVKSKGAFVLEQIAPNFKATEL